MWEERLRMEKNGGNGLRIEFLDTMIIVVLVIGVDVGRI